MRFRNTLYEQSERYRRMAVAIKSSGRDIDAEHRAIVEAVLAGDADRAMRENRRGASVARPPIIPGQRHRCVASRGKAGI